MSAFASPFVGNEYLLLGGQHIAKAMQNVAADLLAQHLPVPRELQFVRARVLKNAAPLQVRRAAAGDHQYVQQQVDPLRLSEIGAVMLHQATQSIAKPQQRLAEALRVSGHPDREKEPVCTSAPVALPIPGP